MQPFLTITILSAEGKPVAQVTANARTFSTGSRGFGSFGKIEIDGQRYQMSLNLVQIGSKNGHATETDAAKNAPDPVQVLAEADAKAEAEASRLRALAEGGSAKLAPQTIGAQVKGKKGGRNGKA